jgi:predicted permease
MRERRVRQLLRWLLGLYPGSFRRALGDDLIETAVLRWREGRWAFWCREVPRFAVDGVLERLRGLPSARDDAAHAWRQLRRAPGHHGLAIATLALGVGASATILTMADAVVLRPLPYTDADALYLVRSRFGSMELSSNSLPNLQVLRSSLTTMTWLGGAADWSPALGDGAGPAERTSALNVTEEYLPRLGARVSAGRMFSTVDFAGGAERVAIVSDALWRRRWGGDASLLGRTVAVDGVGHRVVGVMAAGFRDPGPVEAGVPTGLWIPTRAGDRRFHDVNNYAFQLIGALSGHSSPAAAREELRAAGRGLAEAHPDANRVDGHALEFVLLPLREATVGDARERLLLLAGAVLLLLVLACANVASLLLARGLVRGPELAVRSALGATRARLALQLFAESLVTAGVAGIAGTLLGTGGLHVLLAAAPASIPRLHEVALDVRALLIVGGLTVSSAVVFGTLPAWRGAREAAAIASGARTTGTRGAKRLQSGLVAVEVALSLLLVTGSALLLNSFRNLLRVDAGFDGEDVLVVEVRPPLTATSHADDLAFYSALLERARSLPGVSGAAAIYSVPGDAGGAWSRVTIDVGVPQLPAKARSRAPAVGFRPGEDFVRLNAVYGDLPGVLDMPLVAGRPFDGNPGRGDPFVVLLNQEAARTFFGNEDPIGRRIALGEPGSDAPIREVVGVVGDVLQSGRTRAAEPQVYLPYGQRDVSRLSLLLEVPLGGAPTPESIRRLVGELADGLPVDGLESLAARYAATAAESRFLMFLVSVFAAIGLGLAIVGTYALASNALTRQMRELGIRMAMGARAGMLFRMVLAQALTAAGLGIAAGLLLALALSRFLESMVFGVTARDPATIATAALVIGACAVLASAGPAVRAARVDPNRVLRSD